MKILKNKFEYSEWADVMFDGEKGNPTEYPCYVYVTSGGWMGMEKFPHFLYAKDLREMLIDIGIEVGLCAEEKKKLDKVTQTLKFIADGYPHVGDRYLSGEDKSRIAYNALCICEFPSLMGGEISYIHNDCPIHGDKA